jgi:hypothetical protein
MGIDADQLAATNVEDPRDLADRAWMYGFLPVFNPERVQRLVTTGVAAIRPGPVGRRA